MEMRLYELNFLFPWGSGKVRPYFSIGAGVNTFHPEIPGYSSSTDSRFTGEPGLRREDVRHPELSASGSKGSAGRPTSTAATTTGSATTGATNYYYGDSQWYLSGEATAGVVFAF